MLPGQVQCVQTAVLWARDTAGPLSSVEKLKLIDDRIGGGSLDCPAFPDGISFPEEIIQATAFPLPVTDHLSFSFNKYITSGTVKVYDMHGKLMATQKFTGDRTRISCSNYSPGIYFYKVSQKDNPVATGKIIKE